MPVALLAVDLASALTAAPDPGIGWSRRPLACKEAGRQAEHQWKNQDGSQVWFEFVGVCDAIGCDPACEPDEVWYQIVEMMTLMERRSRLISPESKLYAIRNNE